MGKGLFFCEETVELPTAVCKEQPRCRFSIFERVRPDTLLLSSQGKKNPWTISQRTDIPPPATENVAVGH